MPRRVVLLALGLTLVAASCGGSLRSGRDGQPPLAPRDDWARERVEAVLSLYNLTPQGEAVVRAMRVHHVLGRPGWFGSRGFEHWIGVGQARPASIVHEISHSIWGPFPVIGRPELSWAVPSGERLSPALLALRRDLDTFMQQPPDGFEPLRERLRRIPNLSVGDYPGLYHLGEADIVSLTGGNLNLVPPILRKYYSPFLASGDLASWDEAVRWYRSLPDDQRRVASSVYGIGSVPMDGYEVDLDPSARLPEAVARVAAREQRQRVRDFAEQFDLFFKEIDGEPVANQFHFWRDYLRDTAFVFGAYPNALEDGRIPQAFEFVLELRDLPQDERVNAARERLAREESLLDFVSTLEHPTLAGLIAEGQTAEERRVARRVREALHPFHVELLDLAAAMQREPASALTSFEAFIQGLNRRGFRDLNFVLDVVGSIDRELASDLLLGLSQENLRFVVTRDASTVRALLDPEEVIPRLGFGDGRDPDGLARIVPLVLKGLPARPLRQNAYLDAVYERVVAIGARSSVDAMRVFVDTGLHLEPFLVQHAGEAARLFGSNLAAAVDALREASPIRVPPARAIYRLVNVDPDVAARLTLAFDDRGHEETVEDALAFLAFDAPRLRAQPGLPISLENDARFLLVLADLRGEAWLASALTRATERYRGIVNAGEIDPAFVETYRETLAAVVATVTETESRQRLAAAVRVAG